MEDHTCVQCSAVSDHVYTCDGCGRVFCPTCKEKFLALVQGQEHYTRLLCPNCVDTTKHRILNRTIIN